MPEVKAELVEPPKEDAANSSVPQLGALNLKSRKKPKKKIAIIVAPPKDTN